MLKTVKKISKISLFICFVAVLSVFIINLYVINIGSKYVYNDKDLPKASYGLVFGASVYGNEVSQILARRLDKAIEIFNMNKIDNIIVSGDHRTSDYNEVNAMKEYLIKKGIPESCIFTDHSGLETYDSVLRAKELFNVDSVTLISQKVHIIRALYIAKKQGITAYGVACENYDKNELEFQKTREFFARIKAFIQCDLKYDILIK